jgi:hypothetical protein
LIALKKNNGYLPCLPGGQIHDVHYAFMAQYEGIQTPMDVVLACGVNNMPTTDTAEERDRETILPMCCKLVLDPLDFDAVLRIRDIFFL